MPDPTRALAFAHPPLTESDVERALRAVPMMPFSIPWFPDYPAMARAVLALRGGKET